MGLYKHAHMYNYLPHAAFEDTLKHPDLSIEMALATVRLTTQNNRLVYPTRTLCITLSTLLYIVVRYDLAFPGIRLLTRRYQNLPDLPQVQLLHLAS